MNHKDFDKLLKEILLRTTTVLTTKSTEYSTDKDKLHNFKQAGEKRHTTPEDALLGMKVKHDVSLDDIVSDLERGKLPSIEILEEKCGDSINYIILLEALIKERYNE